MRGLALTEECFLETLPTFEVRGIIKGGKTLDTFEALDGMEADGSLNDMAFDGITDYADGEFVLLLATERFDFDADTYVKSPELDGLYRITTIGSSHANPQFERIGTAASLFEVEDGARFGGTFWKNLTLLSTYVPNESPFVCEQLETGVVDVEECAHLLPDTGIFDGTFDATFE